MMRTRARGAAAAAAAATDGQSGTSGMAALRPPKPEWATAGEATRRLCELFRPKKVVVAAWKADLEHRHAIAMPSEDEMKSWEGASAYSGLQQLKLKDDAAYAQ